MSAIFFFIASRNLHVRLQYYQSEYPLLLKKRMKRIKMELKRGQVWFVFVATIRTTGDDVKFIIFYIFFTYSFNTKIKSTIQFLFFYSFFIYLLSIDSSLSVMVTNRYIHLNGVCVLCLSLNKTEFQMLIFFLNDLCCIFVLTLSWLVWYYTGDYNLVLVVLLI